MNESLSEAILTATIQTSWLGRRFEYFPVIDSTNDYFRDRLTGHSGMLMPHGSMVITDFQTRGRGRLNRRWFSPPNTSLMFSLLFRLGWPPERAHWLTMLGGIAAAHAIRIRTRLDVRLKWPNDLVIARDGRWYKLGGLLLECDFGDGSKVRNAILGMGINVNISADALPTDTLVPATSLLVETGEFVSRLRLLQTILRELEAGYNAAAQNISPQPVWNELLVTLGQPVRIAAEGQVTVEGVAEDTNEWGHLLVRDAKGQIHTITAGDVALQ